MCRLFFFFLFFGGVEEGKTAIVEEAGHLMYRLLHRFTSWFKIVHQLGPHAPFRLNKVKHNLHKVLHEICKASQGKAPSVHRRALHKKRSFKKAFKHPECRDRASYERKQVRKHENDIIISAHGRSGDGSFFVFLFFFSDQLGEMMPVQQYYRRQSGAVFCEVIGCSSRGFVRSTPSHPQSLGKPGNITASC